MLDDLLSHHLDVVFCGTGAGRRSAELRQYYASPGNRFWSTLAEIGLNGKRAAREFFHRPDVIYGVQPERIGRTFLFIAPSTSRAANASWDLSIWHDLAGRVRAQKARPRDLQP